MLRKFSLSLMGMAVLHFLMRLLSATMPECTEQDAIPCRTEIVDSLSPIIYFMDSVVISRVSFVMLCVGVALFLYSLTMPSSMATKKNAPAVQTAGNVSSESLPVTPVKPQAPDEHDEPATPESFSATSNWPVIVEDVSEPADKAPPQKFVENEGWHWSQP